MKLSTFSKLAAVAALCVAGYVDAHAQEVINDASVGNVSVPKGNCSGLSIGTCGPRASGIHEVSADDVEEIKALLCAGCEGGLGAIAIGPIGSSGAVVNDASIEDMSSHTGNTGKGACAGPKEFCDEVFRQTWIELESAADAQALSIVTAYQKQLAHQAATANALIEGNAESLSATCLAEVETLWRSLRNAYSSTGGQLPLYGTPFDRKSPEFRGYVAALVDQSRKTSGVIESKVARNCWDPDATSFLRGGVVGPSYKTEIGRWAN